MKPQRLYWLAEIAEQAADKWLTPYAIKQRVEREAKEHLKDGEITEILLRLLKTERVESRPGRMGKTYYCAAPARA